MGPQDTGFVQHVYTDLTESLYSVFVPHGYDGKRQIPAILFLHGAGETGTDGIRPTKVGIGPAIRKREKTFPFLTIFPQSQRGLWQARSQDGARAIAILDDAMRNYAIDRRRIHLTGISMGGYGTWSLAAAYPERWASIVPICGGGNPGDAERIKHLPCWAFHGAEDEIIPVEESREMIEALRAAGGNPRYTEFAKTGHNSWDPAYAMPELYEWLAGNAKPERVNTTGG